MVSVEWAPIFSRCLQTWTACVLHGHQQLECEMCPRWSSLLSPGRHRWPALPEAGVLPRGDPAPAAGCGLGPVSPHLAPCFLKGLPPLGPGVALTLPGLSLKWSDRRNLFAPLTLPSQGAVYILTSNFPR